MFLDLSRIRAAHERYEKEYAADAFSADESYRVSAPVMLAFDIFKDKRQFRLVGSVETTLRLSCCRCLEPFELPVDATFDLRYLPQEENKARTDDEDEVEIGEDDLSAAFYQNEEIDLGQLAREQFYLALPMKPLCREECRGLCPICGTNLNVAACTCKRDWDDPRFAALEQMKGRWRS